MAEAVWNARKPEHLVWFMAEVLGPLIAATRPPELRSPEAVQDAARAWVLCLKDVSEDVLRAGVDALLSAGPTWMPRPGDLRQACATVILERRRALAPRAAAITAECEQCGGSSWEAYQGEDGVERVKRCGCHARVLALYAGLPAPLALPPGPTTEDAA